MSRFIRKSAIPIYLMLFLSCYPLSIKATTLLTDTFTGTTINTSLWTIQDTSGTNVTQNDRLTVVGSNTWNANGLVSVNTYNRALNDLAIEADMTVENCAATNAGIMYGPFSGSLANGTIIFNKLSSGFKLWSYATAIDVAYTCVNNAPIHVRMVLKAVGGVDVYLDNAVTPNASLTAVQAPNTFTNYPFSLQQYSTIWKMYYDNVQISVADATAPEAPTSLATTASSAQVALTWSAPANGGSAITDYQIEYKLSVDSGWTVFSDGTSTSASATVTGLTNGQSYDFRVSAINAIGTGTASGTATATPQAGVAGIPTNVYGTPASKQITVTWNAPASNGGSAITDYEIDYGIGSGSWTQFADGVSTSTSAVITGLVSGTTYKIRILAINAIGTGAESSTTYVTAGRLGLVDDFTGTTINTSKWTESDSASGGSGGSAGNVQQNGTLTVGGGNGWGTNGVTSVDTFDRTTGNVSVQVTMSGSHCVGGSLFEFGYGNMNFPVGGASYIITNNSGTWVLFYYLNGIPQEQTFISGISCTINVPMVMKLDVLKTGGAKLYINGSNTESATLLSGTFTNAPIWMQTYTTTTTTTFENLYVTIPVVVPDAPTAMLATAGDGQVDLSWTGSATNGTTITDYQIEYRTGSNSYAVFSDGVSTATTATVTGLTNGVQYSFKVSALVDDGVSLASSPVLATPISASAAAPTASSVIASGYAAVGDTLTGLYTYNDVNGDEENTSTYRWLRSTSAGGVYAEIVGATNDYYTLTGDDLNYYIKFEVTPVALALPTTGTPVQSSATAIVMTQRSYINHILSTGQSLSVGYNGSPALSTTQPYANKMLSGASLVALVESGVETISSAMANTITSLVSANAFQVAVTMHGVGGTPYAGLMQGTTPYNNGIAQVTSVFNAAATDLSKVSRVVGVTVIHGESDTIAGNGGNYEGYLVDWQNDYQTDASAITGQSGIIPMFTDQISSFTGYNQTTSEVPMAQLAAAEHNPGKIILVTPKYFFTYSDIAHLTNAGYRWLGEYYGKVMKQVIVDHQPWTPLSPRQIVRNGNVIYARFNVPVAPITLDTVRVSQATNYGFAYADDSSSASISSVTLEDSQTVKITLNGTPTGTNQKLRYAYTGTSGATPGAQSSGAARGNLRDSDPAVSASGNTLYNWSVQFNKDVSVDTTAPVLSSVTATPTTTTAVIGWNTNEPSSSIIDYGLTNTYGHATTETNSPNRIQVHSETIGSLLPCVTYHYRVRGKDLAQNQGQSSDTTFTTGGCPGLASIVSQSAGSITAVSGGSASLSVAGGSITLTIPAGTTVSDAEYQIKQLNSVDALVDAGAPTGYSLAGAHTYDIQSLSDVDTDITAFSHPITVTLAYADSDVTSLDESSLRMYHYHGGSWQSLSSCSIDSGANQISCTTDSFSLFALVGTPASVGGGGGSIGGNTAGSLSTYGCKDATATNYFPSSINHDPTMCIYVPTGDGLLGQNNNKYTFTRNLRSGMFGEDVKELQKYLNSKGFILAHKGPGSPGSETTKFGALTRKFLSTFQAQNGIKPSVGFFGPITRGFIKSSE